ncbi:MAG: SDR family oxidoreductase, partial [Rhodospirillaceae bacterium]
DINLTGVFLCMRYELPEMVKAGGGSIVNIGSTASIGGVATMPAYVASKHAVLGLTRTAAMDHGEDNIRVNVIFPGSFRTPMSERLFGEDTIEEFVKPITPMRRLASADEIAETIVWLCSDRASWVSGTGLSVDGAKRAG